jgi:head-tail adaptor
MARGARRHLVTVQNPGPPVPDGDGGFTQTWTDGTPAMWYVAITPATQADLERLAAGTVISTASHVVRGDFHPEVTTLTRMLFGAQVFAITGTVNVDLRSIEMLCGAVEVVQ